MRFATWVPSEVRERHFFQPSKYQTFERAENYQYIDKVLTSEDPEIEKSWKLIDRQLQNLNKKSAEEKRELIRLNPYINNFIITADTIDDQALTNQTWAAAYGSTYLLLLGALHSAVAKVPKWASMNKNDSEFLEKKKSLISLIGFIKQTDTDFKIKDLLGLNTSALKYSKMSSSLYDYVYSLSDSSKRDCDSSSLSEALSNLTLIFDYIQNYEINLGSEGYGRADQHFFAYELAEYFTHFLGKPNYPHVANMMRVCHGLPSYSADTAKVHHRKVKASITNL